MKTYANGLILKKASKTSPKFWFLSFHDDTGNKCYVKVFKEVEPALSINLGSFVTEKSLRELDSLYFNKWFAVSLVEIPKGSIMDGLYVSYVVPKKKKPTFEQAIQIGFDHDYWCNISIKGSPWPECFNFLVDRYGTDGVTRAYDKEYRREIAEKYQLKNLPYSYANSLYYELAT